MRKLLPWLVSTAVLPALLLFAESLSRIANWPRVGYFPRITEMDENLFHRNRRNLHIVTFDQRVPVTTDGEGNRISRSGCAARRARDSNPAKPVRRIFALGDSTTFGLGVGDEETFCHVLEGLLNRDRDDIVGDSSCRYEVVNMGVIAYTSVQGLRVLRSRALPRKPYLILAGYCMNDGGVFTDDWYRCDGGELSSIPSAPAWAVFAGNAFYTNSRLACWFVEKQRDSRQELWNRKHAGEAGAKAKRWVSAEEYEANLREFAALARAHDCRIVFLATPIQLKYSHYAPYAPLEFGSPDACRRAIGITKRKISVERDAVTLVRMYYYLGAAYECLGEKDPARNAYVSSLSHMDRRTDPRWWCLEYYERLRRVAGELRVPLVDGAEMFTRREFSDNPAGLFVDVWHPGVLGHRLLADEILRVMRKEGIAR